MRFIVSLFKGVFFFVLDVFVLIWHGLRGLLKLTYSFVDNYIHTVHDFTSATGEMSEHGTIFRFRVVRFLFRGFLYLFLPVIILIVPVGLVAVMGYILVQIDQNTRPDFSVDERFIAIAESVDGERPELRDIGATIFTASYLQLDSELNSFLGWTANDMWGLQFWDNRASRQEGVIHGTRELLGVLSTTISRYGGRDEEDTRLVQARQSNFTVPATQWFFPTPAEWAYREGIDRVQQYQEDLRLGRDQNATINITTTDIEEILLAIDGRVLDVPHGRLNARNFDVDWFELDNRVFYAQGAAIVARDALVAMRYAFEDRITEAGAIENMDQAIASLEGAIDFHPWWVMRGDADAMWADHRAKMSRYYTDARARIIDVANAINR